MKAYTYLLHHKPTNTFYYGVRWRNVRLGFTPEEDLWKVYFSSCKKIKSLIKEYGIDSFEYEIRKIFDTVKSAREWEAKVLQRMKVLEKPYLWLNRTDNKAILNEISYDNNREKAKNTMLEKYGVDNPGKLFESRIKLIERNKQLKKESTRKKQSESLKMSGKMSGKNNHRYRTTWGNNHPKGMLGKHHSEETKKKITGRPKKLYIKENCDIII